MIVSEENYFDYTVWSLNIANWHMWSTLAKHFEDFTWTFCFYYKLFSYIVYILLKLISL